MSNLMAMMNTGLSGIIAAQVQIDVTGNNMANVKNPNYSRQNVNLKSAYITNTLYGSFGTGVKVDSITRAYDEILAKTVRNENSSLQYWKNSQTILETVKTYFNELETGSGLGESLQSYFNAWQDLASVPADNSDESYIKRTQVLETATTLAKKINEDRAMLDDVKKTINYDISASVTEINTISESIAALNKKIVAVEADGQNANDLRDQRDGLLSDLSFFAGINVVERPNGEVGVYVAGEPVVDGPNAYKLEAVSRDDGNYDIVWRTGVQGDTSSTVITNRISGGSIQANIQMRDTVLNKYIDQLDSLAKTLIVETNKLHVSGQGLTRFEQLTSTNAVENPTYTISSSYGNLPYDVTSGTFQIKVYNDEGIAQTLNVSIDPNTDTIYGVAEKISSADGNVTGGVIQATVNKDGTIQITAADGYTFAFGSDTSGFLVAAGFNNFFSGTDASTISVDKHIQDNIKYIACSGSGAVGDNTVALSIAGLKQAELSDGITIDDFYSYFVGTIATDKQQVDTFVSTKTLTYNSYYEKLTQVKGVSIEEESAFLIQYQRILQANSRFITAVDEMLSVIINNMGTVGR